MAYFRTQGIDSLITDMEKLGQLSEPITEQMLIAGADKMVAQWKYEIKTAGHIETGALINSIRRDKNSYGPEGAKKIDVYAAGTSTRKGRKIKNATKAFLTNYGTSSKAGTQWVAKAETHAINKVTKAMTDIWDGFLKGDRE